MDYFGPWASLLQNRFFAVFPETIHAGNQPRRTRRKLYPYGLALAVGLLFSGSAPKQVAEAAGTLTFSPASASFGNVSVGTSKSITVTIKNTGTSSVTISGQALHAISVFSLHGVAIPTTIGAGGSTTISISFLPSSNGLFSGNVAFTSNATNSSVVYAISGTGGTVGLTATPSSADFGTVATGLKNTQTVQLKNISSGSVTISSVTASGTGFGVSGITLPLTLAASGTANLTASFAPSVSGTFSGAVTVSSNAGNPTLTVSLSGTGLTASRAISLSTSSLNFGNELVGGSTTQGVAVTNTGNSNVTISGVTVTGTGFSVSSGFSGVTLAAGQTAEMNVVFAPKTAGSVSGSVSVASNANSSPTTVSVSGSGVNSSPHSVALSWGASSSSGIVGYYVYRSTTFGSGFARILVSPTTALRYTDSAVGTSTTYYYAVTAVNASGAESAYSTLATVAIP